MNETHTASEQERVRALAEDYQAQGYDVVVEPDPSRLPPFFSGYRPDLVVTRGDERTVIEVASRQSLSAESQARRAARLIEGQPGWRFELVIVSDAPGGAPAGSVAFGPARAHRALEEGRSLLADGYVGPAILSGWAALEAVLRLLLEAEGVSPRRLAPGHLLKQVVEEGLISRDDYHRLRALMEVRNAVAHGYESEAVGPEAVSTLLEVTGRLLDEASSPESA